MTDLWAVLPYWQAALGISDWDITIEEKSQEDVGEEEFNLGRVASLPGMRVAVVTIAEPHPDGFDKEEALVHELLHVATWHVSEVKEHLGGIGWHIHEQLINQLSAVLVRLRRDSERGLDERVAEAPIAPACVKCGKVFLTDELLRHHENLMHQPDDKQPPFTPLALFKCNFCTAAFNTKFDLEQHITLAQWEYLRGDNTVSHSPCTCSRCRRQHQCAYCNKGFLTYDELIDHVRQHRDGHIFGYGLDLKTGRVPDKLEPREYVSKQQEGD